MNEIKAVHELISKKYKIVLHFFVILFSDHHLKEKAILSIITRRGWLKILKKGEKTYSPSKEV